jgi:two-component system sensor histidine kinase QseC
MWGAGSLAVYLIVRTGLIHQFDLALKADLAALANMTEQTEKGLNFDSAGELMPAFDRADRPDYFELWEQDGSVLQRSPAFALDEEHNLPRQAGPLDSPKLWNVTLPDGLPGRAVGVRFIPKEDEDVPRTPGEPPLAKEVTLVAAVHRDDLDQRLNYLSTVLLVVGGAMAVASVLVVGGVVRRGLGPLSALGERVAAIDASSLQLRFPTDNMPAELLPITQRLNGLLVRLEDSFARERRFSADVAHELRTPIAELRALAEIGLKWPEDRSSAHHALQDALDIALQMESIAIGLMALARCEARLFTARPERILVERLFDEVLPSLATKAREKQLDISLDLPKDTCWFTDATALRSIVTNIMTNAVDYSPSASSIRVHIGKNGFGEQLLISNRNSNLTAEDVPHLFERFWRKDAARSSPLHSGLGLALASAYARSLGMKLTAELNRTEIIFKLSDVPPCRG